MVMVRKPPSIEGNRLLVVGTTAISHNIEDLGLVDSFSITQHVSQLQAKEEILCVLKNSAAAEGGGILTHQEMTDISEAISSPIGIKQLLETLEMAQSDAQQDGEEVGGPGAFTSSSALRPNLCRLPGAHSNHRINGIPARSFPSCEE